MMTTDITGCIITGCSAEYSYQVTDRICTGCGEPILVHGHQILGVMIGGEYETREGATVCITPGKHYHYRCVPPAADVLDRAGRAIWNARPNAEYGTPWHSLHESEKALYRLYAQVAIAEARPAQITEGVDAAQLATMRNAVEIARKIDEGDNPAVTPDYWQGTGDVLRALRDALDQMGATAAAPQKPDRQPIETAPRDGTPILIFGGSDDAEGDVADPKWKAFCRAATRAAFDGEGWIVAIAEAGYRAVERQNPTHWMPLPKNQTEVQAA